ncbi:MAG: HNH endonuclease [Deltaproteobacteria bacterium]|nr:HNH endonuclease [Deltaproteobacteria bacterium]
MGSLENQFESQPFALDLIILEETLLRVHEAALEAARGFKRAEAALIDALIAVERERVFVKLGFSSLFTYAVQALGLSEGVAYNAITVARKAREIPALHEEIRLGTISISKAKKIAAVLTFENQQEWLERARTLSSRRLEKEVARENPRMAVPERVTYVTGKRLSLSLGVDEALMLKFRRAQDRVSGARGRAASIEDTLAELVEFYLRHKDPVEKAKRAVAKNGRMPPTSENPTSPLKKQFTGTVALSTRNPLPVHGAFHRTTIPASIGHPVRVRDEGRCQFRRPDGTICGERRWVDLHHIRPISIGGDHRPENLVTLCQAHHRETHRPSRNPSL